MTVRNGFVTLSGVVEWMYQKIAAERAVKYLRGVKGIFNQITLHPAVVPRDVEKRITEALHRHADVDARRIHVDTDGNRVTLSGSVRSWMERDGGTARGVVGAGCGYRRQPHHRSALNGTCPHIESSEASHGTNTTHPVPIDFSDFSRHAFDRAMAIAHSHEAKVTALHVVPTALASPMLPYVEPASLGPFEISPEERTHIIDNLRRFLEGPQTHGDAVALVTTAAYDVPREILEHSIQIAADLIVMGTHGRSGVERLMLGSVTEKILRKARRPCSRCLRRHRRTRAPQPGRSRESCVRSISPIAP